MTLASTIVPPVQQSTVDPYTVSRRPPLGELLGVFSSFSRARSALRHYHDLLEEYLPEAPPYVYWHLPRITTTLRFLAKSGMKGQRWLDISSDPWFCLLAGLVLKPQKICPTGFEKESVGFRSKTGEQGYQYESRQLRFEGNGESAAFGAREFDVISAFEVIEHLPTHPAPLFAFANSMLKDGGRFILSTPNICGWTKVRRLLNGSCPYDTYQFGGPMCHRKEYTPWELKRLCQTSGFEVVRIETFNPYIGDTCGVLDNLLWIICTGVSAMTFRLIRARNLLFLNGSTIIIEARKTGPFDPGKIIRC